MGGGVITPPYNGWYETYNHHFDDQLTKADNLNWCLSLRVQNYLSLRTSPLKWCGNPPVRGEMYRKVPKNGGYRDFGGNRYLIPFNRGIATTSVRTGLAMTGNLESARQTPIYRVVSDIHRRRLYHV